MAEEKQLVQEEASVLAHRLRVLFCHSRGTQRQELRQLVTLYQV